MGNDATALQQLDRLLSADALLYPQDLRVAAALRKAVILVDGGDAKQAAIALGLAADECALQCTHAPGIANTRARMALEKGDHAAALQLAKSAIGIPGIEKEELANAHRMSGTAEFALGQYVAALNHYQAALELDKELGISKRIVADLNGLGKTLSSELPNVKFRRSLYFVRDLKAGETITADAVRSVRAGYGLPPKLLLQVLGARVRMDVRKNTPVTRKKLVN